MKIKRPIVAAGVCLTAVVVSAALCYYCVFIAPYPNQRLLTASLPPIDRVQIEAVDSGGTEEVKTVLASRDLANNDAQAFANLWRSQWYAYSEANQVMCHFPAYRVRFFHDKTLLLEATVCFHCNNVYLVKSDLLPQMEITSVGLALGGASLQTYLDNLFPGIKREKLPF